MNCVCFFNSVSLGLNRKVQNEPNKLQRTPSGILHSAHDQQDIRFIILKLLRIKVKNSLSTMFFAHSIASIVPHTKNFCRDNFELLILFFISSVRHIPRSFN
jgi:hypothetical protein